MKHEIKKQEEQLKQFPRGAELLSIEVSKKQAAKVEMFLQLLLSWNRKMNLFSRHDTQRLAERHLLESIAWLENFGKIKSPVLDFGSGAGFPGIPIAFFRPESKLFLLESKKKKAGFLNLAVKELGINAEVIPGRVEAEEIQSRFREFFPVIVSRAVADLSLLWRWTAPLLREEGVLIAFKGEALQAELEKLRRNKSSLKFDAKVLDYNICKNLWAKPYLEKRKIVMVNMTGKGKSNGQ